MMESLSHQRSNGAETALSKGRMQMLDRTNIVEGLHNGICEVTFTKSDGTERVMKCTLSKSYLPPDNRQVLTEDGPRNPNIVTVWDTEANGWRSFAIDRVKSFNRVGSVLNG
jgi:hypothetical protein